MTDREYRSTRQQFLKAAGLGAAGVAVGGGLVQAARGGLSAARATQAVYDPAVSISGTTLALGATDGFIDLPNLVGRPSLDDGKLYTFGFRKVEPPPGAGSDVASLEETYKGLTQQSAPILDLKQVDPALTTGSGQQSTNPGDVRLTLTNLGLVGRPDLTDSHTVHWHGFRAPLTVFDGVPEVSVSVPIQRQFTYFYRPHHPGTYMYHCHFEDVEHVQMGMTSIVFVRPLQDGNTTLYPSGKYVFNDGDGSTGFDREFAILLTEMWSKLRDNDLLIQETLHTDYDPNYWAMNGRVYPQTILPNSYVGTDDYLKYQPISSLVRCNANERVLLRLANLGYQQHSMQLPGIPMKVVGQDATLLRSGTVADLSYMTNTVYIGPGEARDVIFTAPTYNALRPSNDDGDGHGPYNFYFFKNRNSSKLNNNGIAGGVPGVTGNDPGLGGMATEVRVYQNALGTQAGPNT